MLDKPKTYHYNTNIITTQDTNIMKKTIALALTLAAISTGALAQSFPQPTIYPVNCQVVMINGIATTICK